MFNCNNCNKEYKSKAGLTNHAKSCINNNFICQYCNKLFACKQNLKKHLDEKICTEYHLHIINLLRSVQYSKIYITHLGLRCWNKILS